MASQQKPKCISKVDSNYQLWPEDSPPTRDIPCEQCELADQSQRLIWGEGNPNASVWILLDNPGLRELPSGDSFVCGTRQTLQSAIRMAGFVEDQLYVTFVVRRRPLRTYDKVIERTKCMQNFHYQLAQSRPGFLICLGDVAVQAIRQDAKASVKDFRHSTWRVGSTQVHATYHPLAIRRRPNLLNVFESDWRSLYLEWSRANVIE